jgi:hypothetical protein
MLFDQVHINKFYTKRDCFILMDADSEEYHNTKHLNAAFCLFKKCHESLEFVKKWQYYCYNYNIISDDASSMDHELPEFRMHRHDQSILTNLAKSLVCIRINPCVNGEKNGEIEQILHIHKLLIIIGVDNDCRILFSAFMFTRHYGCHV